MSKRWWFQIHLSTAVAVMLVSSVFVGANVLLSPWYAVNKNEGQRRCMRGWPCAVYSDIPDNLTENDDGGGEAGGVSGFYEYQPHWRISGAAFNAVVLFALMAMCTISCEYIVRRREARR